MQFRPSPQRIIMSYSEWKYEKMMKDAIEASSSSNSVYESKRKTVDEFVKMYSIALTEYLMTQYPNGQKGHIEDIATGNAMFAEAFYLTISVL